MEMLQEKMFTRREPSGWLVFGLPVVAVGLALLVARSLNPVVRVEPYLFFWAVVAFCAWYGGLWAGVLAIVLSVAGVELLLDDLPDNLEEVVVLLLRLGVFAAVLMASSSLRRVTRAHRHLNVWFREVFTYAHDAILLVNEEGEVVYANDMLFHLSGAKRGDVVGYPLEEVLRAPEGETPLTSAELIEHLREADGPVELSQYRFVVHVDGSSKPVSARGIPVRDGMGKIIGAVVTIEDISDIRAAEAILQRQLAEIETIYKSVPVGLCVMDTELRYVRINDRLAEMNGLSVEAHLGERGPDLLPDMDPEMVRLIEKVIETGEPVLDVEISGRLPAHPNEDRAYMVSYFPLHDGQGKVQGVNSVVRDITALKRMQMRERQARITAEALRETAVSLNSSLDLDDILDRMLQSAGRVVPHDASFVLLLSDGTAYVRRSMGFQPDVADELETLNFPTAKTEALQVMISERRTLVIPDIQAFDGWVAGPVTLSGDFHGYVGVPIWWRGEVIGILSLLSHQADAFQPEQAETLRLFAEAISTALRNAQLYNQAQELAAIKERQRMARDLHDAINQTLYSASVLVQTLPALAERDPARVMEELKTLNRLIRGAQAEMRVLLAELRPEQLKRIGLREQYAQLITAFEGRMKNIVVDLHLDNGNPVPDHVAVAFYRVTQEALNNIAKHSHARRVEIELVTSPRQVRLKVADDGRGFDLKAGGSGLGLTSMRERAQNIGAELTLAAAEGEGTRVEMVWQRPVADQ